MVGMANVLGSPMDYETTHDIQQEIRKILPGYYNLGKAPKVEPNASRYFSNGYTQEVGTRYSMNEKGRDLDKFSFGVFQFTFINDDTNKINQRIQGSKFELLTNPQRIKELGYWKDEYEELYIEATGYKPEELNILKIDRDDVTGFDLRKLQPIVNEIPDDLIRESMMIGTKEDIIKRIRKYIEAGANHFIFSSTNGASSKNAPFTYWDASRIISEEIIPLFKDGNV